MKSRLTMMLLAICTTALAQYSVPNLDPRVTVIESTLPQKVSTNDAGRQLNWAGADIRIGLPLYSGSPVSLLAMQAAINEMLTNYDGLVDMQKADVRVAPATATNHPVTKSQMDNALTNTATAAQGAKADAAIPAPAGATQGDMLRFDGTNWSKIPETVLVENRYLYFGTDQTVTEIQAAIDAVPRNLNGYNLYLAFSNGTYSLTDTLYVRNFQNGSTYFCTTSLVASSLTVPYTNQPVKIQNDGSHSPVVQFDNCDNLIIYDINFHYANAYTNKNTVVMVNCSVAIQASMFSSVTTNSVNNITGLLAQRSIFDIRACQFNNCKYGFHTLASVAAIQASGSGPVRPYRDLLAGAAIMLVTQTNLTTATGSAGLIINQAGATLP